MPSGFRPWLKGRPCIHGCDPRNKFYSPWEMGMHERICPALRDLYADSDEEEEAQEEQGAEPEEVEGAAGQRRRSPLPEGGPVADEDGVPRDDEDEDGGLDEDVGVIVEADAGGVVAADGPDERRDDVLEAILQDERAAVERPRLRPRPVSRAAARAAPRRRQGPAVAGAPTAAPLSSWTPPPPPPPLPPRTERSQGDLPGLPPLNR